MNQTDISVILYFTLSGIVWYITTQPGEIFQVIPRLINTLIVNSFLKKLLTCPYCLFFQLTFFWSLIVGANYVLSPMVVMVLIFVFIKLFK